MKEEKKEVRLMNRETGEIITVPADNVEGFRKLWIKILNQYNGGKWGCKRYTRKDIVTLID